MSLTPPKSTLLNLGHLSQARSASTGYHKKSVEIFGLGKQGAAAQDLRLHRRRGRKRERRQGLRRGGEGWRRSFAAQTRGTVRKRGLLLIICFKKFLFVFLQKPLLLPFLKKPRADVVDRQRINFGRQKDCEQKNRVRQRNRRASLSFFLKKK